ncbi:transposase [Methylorubrum populi]|uniref:Transposase n=1 Tax=Methylorubrum populi TaxID=223967 RepID=A0A161JJZ4_9HYPH|nr:transposase [Methylorubrum populi]
MYAAEQERADLRAAREAWFEAQPELDPDRLVFLDETAAATNMARPYGWAPCGERCRLAAPLGCQTALNIDPGLEWAPDGGHDQAAVLTVCRVCCSSNCTGLR